MRVLLFLALLLPGVAAAEGLVAARNLPAGTILAPDDLAVAPTGRPGLNAPEAVGKQLRTAVYEGRAISAGQLTAPTLVSRNQLVTLAYESAALRIEIEGRALGAGGEGDVIRVMNLSSRATLMARINADGTLTVAQR
ncbi:flagellar basal body P-ring formation chaperone FlgA [Paracoccus sp. (in: a-proteobacteria)]|uniref:flagellar basal body P-ring formation chaperone FlgA n=1 Tax=Paracoccus sp. TaxID=267 RepID=UPI0026DF7921|nr:flagellar basal body P-ring formation chaperone FlgA [Paracoccus sp. (in: a-proteobacteria)]MDO5371069.1 flagellar basal body P-ring formation chaperone FlgA [Paracoccus sp. (in: a-proteobacteria)]